MLRLVTAPSERPVSLDVLKSHVMAADFNDDDNKLGLYLDAAIAYVAKETSIVLAPAVYRVERRDWWSSSLELLVTPIRDVVSVKYLDSNGAEQTLSESEYRWIRTSSGGRIKLLNLATLPALASDRADAVRIEIEAGCDITGATGSGDDPELLLPPQARQSILMLAAHWYENREAVSPDAMNSVPFAVSELNRQIMVYR